MGIILLDIFLLTTLFIFIIFGFLRGFKKEIISTLNIISILFLSFLYANDFGSYIAKELKFFDLDTPVFIFTIIGSISIFIISSVFFYFLGKILLYPLLNFENNFFDKSLGIIFSFFKGFLLISALISVLDYYEMLYVLENFDKSSSFLDYFLKFSVQLKDVWNHWYI